jgi:hypothetical protein
VVPKINEYPLGAVGPQALINEDLRQRAQAAVAFHIGGKYPGLDLGRVSRPIAERYLELAQDNPAMISTLESDVNALFALTDDEIAAKMARGERIVPQGDVFDAIQEVAWEVGAAEFAARVTSERADAMSGTFEALTSQDALALGEEFISGYVTGAVELGGARAGVGAPGGLAKAQSFQTLFDVGGAWSYSPSSRLLAVTVGDQTIGIDVGPGFNPENHLDVMTEVVRAQADGRVAGGSLTGAQGVHGVQAIIDKAHEIGGFLDEHPTGQRVLDRLWYAFTSAGGLNPWSWSSGEVQGGPGPLERQSDAMRDEQGRITAESVRLASVIPLPTDQIVASIAGAFIADNPGVTSQSALEMAAETVAENRDALRDEFETLTQAELLTQLEGDVEGRSTLGGALETGMGEVLERLEWWDQFTQWIGINKIDFDRDMWGGFGALIGGDLEEAKQRFDAMVTDRPEFGTTASEYLNNTTKFFHLEGGWADAANLAVGGVFDPSNYIFVGGRGLRALARQALAQPGKYGAAYLRMGAFPHVANQIANAGRVGALPAAERIAEVARLGLTGADEVAALAGDEVLDAAGKVLLPAVERVAVSETVANTRGVMSVVGSSVGLPDAEYADMLRLAVNPASTVDEVNEVWLRAMNKNWLPNSLGGPVRHKTIEGVGRVLDAAVGKIPGVTVSPEKMDTFFKYLSKQSTVRTFRLGENMALTNYGDLAVQFFPADPERVSRLVIGAADARMAAGDPLAMSGAAAATKEQARRAMHDLGGPTRQMLDAADPAAVNQNLREIQHALTTLHTQGYDEATEASIRTELNRMHKVMSRRVDDAAPRLAARREAARTAHRQLNAATAVEADSVRTGNAVRNAMADQAYRLYEEKAIDLNTQFGREVIPVIPGKVNPFAPDVPVRDWSVVTGLERGTVESGDEDLALMMGMAADNVELARQANAIGMLSKTQHVMLPASPYEITVFEKIGGDDTLYRKWMTQLRNDRLHKWTRRAKLAFVVNLLFTPITAGKVTLDETSRFLAVTGKFGGFARSTVAGIPGVGRATESAVKHLRGGGTTVANSYAAANSRNVGGMFPDDFADYGWVPRPPRRVTDPTQMNLGQYRLQVERWLNGSLLQDERFRQYARWVDQPHDPGAAPPGFLEWWEHGVDGGKPGRVEARQIKVTIRNTAMVGDEITADDAFEILGNVLDNWLNLFVDEGARGPMRERLLRAAVTAGDQLATTGPDARLLNAVSQVPGLSGKTDFGSRAFNVFFGAPAGRRSGVFYEQFFDDNYQTLLARHGERVLTVERLMDYAKLDRETAEFYLKQGSDNAMVSQMIAERGAVTEAQLAASAAANAERRTDDLMYTFTSSSLFGRGAESALLFPFARAQVDFLSWWTDHMVKPLTLPVSMEMRNKLAGSVAGGALAAVERLPLNLRAWAKYAHMVATVNNDQESVVDQMIDNLTFFPMHFDSEFLLDVTPQLGPLPSWMFDAAVDAGWIGEDLEKEIMAVFPALEFTETADDPLEEIFNRILPNSRRSLRDYTVGMFRGAYALRGRDLHSDPGALGSLANIVADNKVPASTGDFQAALGSDWLSENVWNLVPGSPEWNEAIIGLSVEGATQANRREWTQDQRDRILPLTGYDAEYRALRAYEGLFDDQRFTAMSAAGLFSIADLLPNDEGTPRIKEAWDRYIAGSATPEELAYLDDRLTSIYFDAGRVEVLPGFSYMDYLHLTNPELAVNLIAKNEDSGIPSRGGVRTVGDQQMTHAEFRSSYISQLTGRLQNIPPGPQGGEMVADARRAGWIVSRRMESTPTDPGWMQDAAEAVYKSGQRGVHGVWEAVSHRTWQAGVKKSIEGTRFTLQTREAMVLKAAGMDVVAGTEYSYGEFFSLLDDFDERFDVAQPMLVNTLEKGAVHGQLALHNDAFGQGLLDAIHQAELDAKKMGFESVEDWPEPVKEKVRDRFSEAINLGYTTEEGYRQEIEPFFGPLNYEPPVPPPVAELESGLTLSGEELADVEVVDGDTISVLLADGPMRVRLIGINAPEVTQEGYQDARTNLQALVEGADEVVVGFYKPELFGMSQLTAPGEHRLIAWLYIDGVPIYDPSVFTAQNPRGAGVGGTVLDLEAIYEAGRQ